MEREVLLDLLVQHSYRWEPQPVFRLASGRFSNFYINCKTTTMKREAAPLIARAFAPYIPSTARAVGGLTMGADPIAYAIRDLCQQKLDAFVVRKEPKEHGLELKIEGPVSNGLPVVVVDDVVTTGGSTLLAMQQCRDRDLSIEAVVVLVDRQEDGGLDKIRHAAGSVPVHAIFTHDHLHARWLLRGAGANKAPAGLRTAAG